MLSSNSASYSKSSRRNPGCRSRLELRCHYFITCYMLPIV